MINIDDRLIKEVSPKIRPNALSVLLAIAIHLNQKTNRCFPSHERLMMLTGMGKNAVYDALGVLKEAGLLVSEQKIDSESKKFGRRTFRLTTRFIKIFVDAADAEPLPENREPENREPENREPENREPENRETYQLNNSEQINQKEQIKKVEEEIAAAAEISNFPLNEKPLSQTNGAPPDAAAIIELHDPETPGATIYDGVPTVPSPPNRINLYDRPNAKTPAELQDALIRFYVEFENEWSAGVLENSKGRRYPKERRTEIVRAFCCHAIKSNRGGDTFQMLNADLQAWFLRQPEFERTQPATTNKNSAVYEPPRNAVY